MASHEYIVERIAELTPEDLDALEGYFDRLHDAGDYRVILRYEPEVETIRIQRVRHRSDACR